MPVTELPGSSSRSQPWRGCATYRSHHCSTIQGCSHTGKLFFFSSSRLRKFSTMVSFQRSAFPSCLVSTASGENEQQLSWSGEWEHIHRLHCFTASSRRAALSLPGLLPGIAHRSIPENPIENPNPPGPGHRNVAGFRLSWPLKGDQTWHDGTGHGRVWPSHTHIHTHTLSLSAPEKSLCGHAIPPTWLSFRAPAPVS